MRQKKVKFLITTTILERGVTFPGIDVIILGADDEVFSVSSLVQIAGRVGRKRDRPTGNVDFFIASYTKRVVDAQNQIKHMNYLGAKLLWANANYAEIIFTCRFHLAFCWAFESIKNRPSARNAVINF